MVYTNTLSQIDFICTVSVQLVVYKVTFYFNYLIYDMISLISNLHNLHR